jgi:hypothetical protein
MFFDGTASRRGGGGMDEFPLTQLVCGFGANDESIVPDRSVVAASVGG